MHFRKIFKPVFIAGLIFCGSFSAFAQRNYFTISGGYNWGIGSFVGLNQSQHGVERVKVTYGKGINANLAFGHMFDPNFGFEIGAGYLVGGKNKQHMIRKENNGQNYFEQQEDWEHYSRMFMFKPAVVISAGRQGINPYGKFGAIIGLGKIYEHLNATSTATYEREFELKGGFAWGAYASLGAEFNAASKATFFTEITFNGLSYAAEKGEVTKFSVNGKDQVTTWSVQAREIDYVNGISDDENPDAYKPTKRLKVSNPFSSAGINIGYRLNF